MCSFLSKHFGVIDFNGSRALFKLSEVWLSHESTAANRGLDLGNVMPIGTTVSKCSVQYIQTVKRIRDFPPLHDPDPKYFLDPNSAKRGFFR